MSTKKVPAKKAAKKAPVKKAATKVPAKKAAAKKVAKKIPAKKVAKKAAKKVAIPEKPGALRRGAKLLGEVGKKVLKSHGKQIGIFALGVVADRAKKGTLKSVANFAKNALS